MSPLSSGVPLRVRLALGGAVLLIVAIAAFGVIAYETSKRSAIEAAEARARAAVYSLGESSSITLLQLRRTLAEVAADPAVVQALRTGTASSQAREVMQQLVSDSGPRIEVGLRALSGEVILATTLTLPTWAFDETLAPDSAGFGRARARADSILFEATAPVRDGGTLLGSVVRIRKVATNPRSLQTIRGLMGESGGLLFGNADGSLWSDLNRPVEGPPTPDATRYRKQGADYIVATYPIRGTPYLFAAEFPVAAVLAPVQTLVREYALLGAIIVLLGVIASFWASGRVTRPLTELTQAAERVAAGERPEPGPALMRTDEVGRLQRASQTMAENVWQARAELEQQVRDRTRALEDQEKAVAALRESEERLQAERSRLEAALRDLKASEDALRLADRRKDDFLAMLAHELRNPLAPIRNAAQILKLKTPDDPEIQWSRDVIHRQVGQMTRLLDDLLDVSRILHNRLELRLQRVDLRDVLTSAVETSGPLISRAGHRLDVELPRHPIELNGDPVRLAQVFSNLLNNSAKYIAGSGQIRVTAETRNDEVVVRVSDNGIGIPAESLPHIFERFTRVSPSLDGSRDGLGIGLSLVQGLVTLHGGRVTAQSAGPGRGSTFTVELPLAPALTPSTSNGSSPVEPAAASRQRVLVADDLEDSAETLATLLMLNGHEVWTARDGEEALQVAAERRPGIVLLDIGMPRLDGYEVCRRLRMLPWGRDALIVALTGWGQDRDRRQTEDAGFDHHLVKPVDPADLLKLFDGKPT
jgi:signal transduction histidine kinase/CheY-like chemotaxis protein